MNLAEYLAGPFTRISGWCSEHVFKVVEPVAALQRSRGIVKPVAEIGVFHGKFFIGLVKSAGAPADNHAIDVFSLQQFNLDSAGKGDLEKFRASLRLAGEDESRVRILERDSLTFSDAEVLEIRARTGGFSFFSVDGCHRIEHTLSDLRMAMRLAIPEALIFVDDYYNPAWPGVQEGVCKLYHSESPLFVPVAYVANKLVLCHLSFHQEYATAIWKHVTERCKGMRTRKVERFGYQSLNVVAEA